MRLRTDLTTMKRFPVYASAMKATRWIVGCTLLAVGCSAPESSTIANEIIVIDGSSTVYPITAAAADAYQAANHNAPAITVSFSGTTAGFRQFCNGETVISNASRPISAAEMEACKAANVRYYELPVAFDAITVVVNPDNAWANDITLAELNQAWRASAQREVVTWQQLRATWPNRPLNLYGPGNDSGTYDYFTEVITGGGDSTRSDYSASEDDSILVDQVARDPNALGYFGFAYYEDNTDRLQSLAIDSGAGPVAPTAETVEQGRYQPLSRPLFIYVNATAVQQDPDLQAFVQFYLENSAELADGAGYIPLPEESSDVALTQLFRNKVGTAFGGTLEPGLTIGEVLQKQKTF